MRYNRKEYTLAPIRIDQFGEPDTRDITGKNLFKVVSTVKALEEEVTRREWDIHSLKWELKTFERWRDQNDYDVAWQELNEKAVPYIRLLNGFSEMYTSRPGVNRHSLDFYLDQNQMEEFKELIEEMGLPGCVDQTLETTMVTSNHECESAPDYAHVRRSAKTKALIIAGVGALVGVGLGYLTDWDAAVTAGPVVTFLAWSELMYLHELEKDIIRVQDPFQRVAADMLIKLYELKEYCGVD